MCSSRSLGVAACRESPSENMPLQFGHVHHAPVPFRIRRVGNGYIPGPVSRGRPETVPRDLHVSHIMQNCAYCVSGLQPGDH